MQNQRKENLSLLLSRHGQCLSTIYNEVFRFSETNSLSEQSYEANRSGVFELTFGI